MNKILVNQKDFNFEASNFSILIHGEEGSGASLYTVTTAVNLFSRGFHIVFLCGYPQAEEEFVKQLGKTPDVNQSVFYTKEKVLEFKEFLINTNNGERIIFVKNIELFGQDVLDLVLAQNNIVVSGDISKSIYARQILTTKFNTKVFFSALGSFKPSVLQKYEGFFKSNTLEGATRVKFE